MSRKEVLFWGKITPSCQRSRRWLTLFNWVNFEILSGFEKMSCGCCKTWDWGWFNVSPDRMWLIYIFFVFIAAWFIYFFKFIYYYTLSCRVHVHNVQVCYICILVPCWCAAPINSSFTSGITPNAIPPPSPLPMIGPGVWCSPSRVQVISLFSSHLWVRTCGVWFSVLVIVC